jgi:hypothetical protein
MNDMTMQNHTEEPLFSEQDENNKVKTFSMNLNGKI